MPRSPRPHPNTFSQFIHSPLTLRLVGMLLVLMAGGAALSAWTAHKQAREGWNRTVQQCALRIGNVIVGATHIGMLKNEKSYVADTIRQVASTAEVEHIRVYDTKGIVRFSDEQTEMGSQALKSQPPCVQCHQHEPVGMNLPDSQRVRIIKAPDGHRIMAATTLIPNSLECQNGACHFHASDEPLLGVIDVQVSLASADAMESRQRNMLALSSALITLLLIGATILFVNALVTRPIRTLVRETRKVAEGDLQTHIELRTHTELNDLAQAFNHMTRSLSRAESQNRELAATLEDKVVAKTDQLHQAQRQIVHMEKMASLGKLAATVAHELNNPLAGILNYAKLLTRIFRESPTDDDGASQISARDRTETMRYLQVIQDESKRTGDIVRNLLLFSRSSAATFEPCHLTELIERSTLLIRHHLTLASVQVQVEGDDIDDRLTCDGNQLQQALVALMMNAVEAMPEGGTLTLRCEDLDDHIGLHVCDTGIGIPAAVLDQIFEPFFSTKEQEGGVGLGLAVVYGIVRGHSGQITAESVLGQGTTFHIRLPREPETPSGGS